MCEGVAPSIGIVWGLTVALGSTGGESLQRVRGDARLVVMGLVFDACVLGNVSGLSQF